MLRFHLFELDFWKILSMRLKEGHAFDQAWSKVRNYLAHHYLRERVIS
jgi:hypothetical protein